MHEGDKTIGIQGRTARRVEHDGEVTIEFPVGTLVGSGQNISTQGVFFTADAALPVVVRMQGVEAPIAGTLVRLESMGEGRIGIAVRFDANHPDLVPPTG